MRKLDYRPPSGKKPFYKGWKFYACAFGVIILIGFILEVTGYNEKQEAIKAEEAVARTEEVAKKKADKDAEREAQLAEIDAQIAEEERLAEEKTAVSASAKPDRSVEIRVLAEGYADKYDGSEIVELKINENLGVDDGSYIVLANMSYPRQNSAKMTREMIEMYSSDLAANLAKEADVSAVTVFWEVPRFLEDSNAAKFAYERLGDGMRLESRHIATELQ